MGREGGLVLDSSGAKDPEGIGGAEIEGVGRTEQGLVAMKEVGREVEIGEGNRIGSWSRGGGRGIRSDRSSGINGGKGSFVAPGVVSGRL